MKKINVFIVMLVFMTAFFFVTPVHIVKASTYTITFESGSCEGGSCDLGDPYIDDFLTTQEVAVVKFQVDNGNPKYGARNFLLETVYGGWWNLTLGGETLTDISWWNSFGGDGGNMWFYVNMFSSQQYANGDFDYTSLTTVNYDCIISMLFSLSGNSIGYYDYNDIYQQINTYQDGTYYHMNISFNLTDEIFYEYRDAELTGTPTNITAVQQGLSIDRIFFYGTSGENWDIDEVVFTTTESYPGGETGGESGSIEINVYDSLTGNLMYLVGSDVTGHLDIPLSRQFTYPDQLLVNVKSDLWAGEYDSNMFGQTITITDEWDDGSSHTLSFSGYAGNNIFGWVETYTKSWWNYTVTFDWYKNRVYSFTLTSTDMGLGGYPYCDDMNWQKKGCMSDGDKHKFCLDKGTYSLGERIYLKWYMPDKAWLAKNGDYAEGWRLTLWDESEFTWDPLYMWWEGSNWFAPPSCDWVYFDLIVDDLYGFTTNYQEYSFKLMNFQTLWPYVTPAHLNFWVTGEGIEPEADILYISPDPPRTFEQATIAWTSNCTIKIETERLGSGEEPEVYYSGVRNGTAYYNTTFWLPGEYVARIYGYDGHIYLPAPLDTLAFNVTGEQQPWPGGEYLEIIGDPYYVAGEIGRNVTFRFKTLIDNASLTITDADGGTSWFSRTVNKSDYMHSFWLPSFAPIGKWTATLTAQGTHTRDFWVISEEGNYIEFTRNVFYDDQYFNIKIKHTRYVKLDFYKFDKGINDWVAQGEPWLMNIGVHAKELLGIRVPYKYADPEVGSWRVEMWRLNEENVVKFLAGDNCTVVRRPSDPVTPADSDLGGLVQNAFPDPTVRTIIGLVICLILTLLPYLVGLKMKERHVTINIPTVIYAICFGVGVAISYILGFFGVEILFFIVFILISIMAFMFLYGKKSASSGSDA